MNRYDPQMGIYLSFARQEAARVWCSDENKHKIMDTDLAEEFSNSLANWMCKYYTLQVTGNEMAEAINAMNSANCRPDVHGGFMEQIRTLGNALSALSKWKEVIEDRGELLGEE